MVKLDSIFLCLFKIDRVDLFVCFCVFLDEKFVYILFVILYEIDKVEFVLKNKCILDLCFWELLYCEIGLNVIVFLLFVVFILFVLFE